MSGELDQAVRELVRAVVQEERQKMSPETRAQLRFGGEDDLPPAEELLGHASELLGELRRQRKENDRLRAEIAKLKRVASAVPVGGLSYRERIPHGRSEHTGVVYAVALIPEITPFRIKIGYSARYAGDRLSAFRTACPTAVIVGAWSAEPFDEARVHAALPNRIGASEVFICNDIEVLLTEIDGLLGGGR